MLYEDLHLSRVLDLRTARELLLRPECEVPHVAYIHFPLLKATTLGISKSSSANLEDRLLETDDPAERLAMVPRMEDVYPTMLTNDFSRTNLRALMASLAGYELGGTIFHCTSGKDRTGMITATLLTVLGVSREEILKDYMRSSVFAEKEAEELYKRTLNKLGDESLARQVRRILEAHESYLQAFFDEMDRQYGTPEQFIRAFLRINDESLRRFRDRVLE
jgi:protein-tyrosine phosphatase